METGEQHCVWEAAGWPWPQRDLLHESLLPVTNASGKEWVPGPQLKYWGWWWGRVQFH